MYTREERMEISKTILRQLGGNKFLAMTGAKNLTTMESGLGFKIPGTSTKNHINLVNITLDPNDTYSVKFENVRMKKCDCIRKVIAFYDYVYADQLQSIFKSETGLDTHL